ncbi:Toll-like receptor 3 [Lasiodiplodia theobromae]|uniref:Toll-like receptor 3 n=1 Tax=Lasiodiplodia theobromae TaxID=45133 RepID=UPI0015C323DB|nr:Toll-like receptor 3 [Lasiodiplodia theobromae]KAF4539122.1 Toll-like receptor 3 [Lasiodiplodia theobromae]
MSANGPSATLRPPGQNGPQGAKPSSLTPEKRSYLIQYLNSTIANELPAETQDDVPAKDAAVANNAPDAERRLTPTDAALKLLLMRKVSVALIADWRDLVLMLQIWLMRNGVNYMIDYQESDNNVEFVFEGSVEGKKAAQHFYKVWNGRAHTDASDSPICAMKMMVITDIVSLRKQ